MGLLNRLFSRAEKPGEDPVITLDVERRRTQLLRLERALDALARRMREVQSVDNPGWRERINEYARLAGDVSLARRGTPTREGIVDLVFEVRPVFTGATPQGLDPLVPLQAELLVAAEDLRDLLPGERT